MWVSKITVPRIMKLNQRINSLRVGSIGARVDGDIDIEGALVTGFNVGTEVTGDRTGDFVGAIVG